MIRNFSASFVLCLPAALFFTPAQAELPEPKLVPLHVAVDLNLGESHEVTLTSGKKVTVKVLDLMEQRDSLRGAVRKAEVKVLVDGKEVTLVSANYRLPVKVGEVQIDCPVTSGYRDRATKTTGGLDVWGLEKAVRLRLWPADSPLVNPATFGYPAKQRWFASQTQMANEPVYVDGGEKPGLDANIYYHYGLDIGGAEALVDVVAATDALVVSVGKEVLPGYADTPVSPRYDVIYLLDDRGWFYRYSHLHTIRPEIRPGTTVKLGQPLGLLGKEGGSGGWSHLHFDISGRQPSGKWGIIDGYAFLWEAYIGEHKPQLLAVARPHHFAAVGEKVTLDGSRSWSDTGSIASHDWTCTDGLAAKGPTLERSYDKPGVYSEVLRVTDKDGRIDYDFAIVNVVDNEHPEALPPSIHAVYAPTLGIKPGQEIKFLVRTFRTTDGEETWDFGDGTPSVTVKSDGNVVQLAKDGYAATTHKYDKPGVYLVRVSRTNKEGFTATAHLKVFVEEDEKNKALQRLPKPLAEVAADFGLLEKRFKVAESKYFPAGEFAVDTRTVEEETIVWMLEAKEDIKGADIYKLLHPNPIPDPFLKVQFFTTQNGKDVAADARPRGYRLIRDGRWINSKKCPDLAKGERLKVWVHLGKEGSAGLIEKKAAKLVIAVK